MNQFTYFAQTANYNCTGAPDSSYGASGYGTCGAGTSTGTTTTQPGAPDTGEFFGFVTSGAFSIILPLVLAVIIVAAASFAVIRKKRKASN